MVVINCEKIVDYVSVLKNLFLIMAAGWGGGGGGGGGLAKLQLKIVINYRVLSVLKLVNNCKKIVDYVNALKN